MTSAAHLIRTTICAAALLSLAGCGDNEPCTTLTGVGDGLLIAEVVPGSHVELFNPTSVAIDLDSTTYFLCSPFVYEALTGAIVPAGGSVVIAWPFTTNVSAARTTSGELQLYRDSDFESESSMADFVCWGTRPTSSRMSQAGRAGLWSGDCAPAITNGSIQRLSGTDGATAEAYESAAPMRVCAP